MAAGLRLAASGVALTALLRTGSVDALLTAALSCGRSDSRR
jgi:hypothetical protein